MGCCALLDFGVWGGARDVQAGAGSDAVSPFAVLATRIGGGAGGGAVFSAGEIG